MVWTGYHQNSTCCFIIQNRGKYIYNYRASWLEQEWSTITTLFYWLGSLINVVRQETETRNMKLYIQLSRRLYLTVLNATVYEDREADRVITDLEGWRKLNQRDCRGKYQCRACLFCETGGIRILETRDDVVAWKKELLLEILYEEQLARSPKKISRNWKTWFCSLKTSIEYIV